MGKNPGNPQIPKILIQTIPSMTSARENHETTPAIYHPEQIYVIPTICHPSNYLPSQLSVPPATICHPNYLSPRQLSAIPSICPPGNYLPFRPSVILSNYLSF